MAKGAGGGGRGGRAGGSVLARMMPAKNREDLGISAMKGLPEALSGTWSSLMYNPKTGVLLAGGGEHADLQVSYAPNQNYDDFVKIWHEKDNSITIFVDRHTASGPTDAWNKAFRAARAMRSAGFSPNTTTRLMAFLETQEVGEFSLGEA